MATVTEFDTIAAISTPPGEGAISIVRMSGEEARFNCAKSLFGQGLDAGEKSYDKLWAYCRSENP